LLLSVKILGDVEELCQNGGQHYQPNVDQREDVDHHAVGNSNSRRILSDKRAGLDARRPRSRCRNIATRHEKHPALWTILSSRDETVGGSERAATRGIGND